MQGVLLTLRGLGPVLVVVVAPGVPLLLDQLLDVTLTVLFGRRRNAPCRMHKTLHQLEEKHKCTIILLNMDLSTLTSLADIRAQIEALQAAEVRAACVMS